MTGPAAPMLRWPDPGPLAALLVLVTPPADLSAVAGPVPLQASPAWRSCGDRGDRHFTALVFGDEPAAIMTALEVVRQLQRLDRRSPPSVALVSDADLDKGLGGTLVRGGLAYLDRNQVPSDMRRWLPAFAPSSELYRRFLAISGAGEIAVDPNRASAGFRRALEQAGVTVQELLASRAYRQLVPEGIAPPTPASRHRDSWNS